MFKKVILFSLFCLFINLGLCYGLEWKKLHEEADKESLPEALAAAQAKPGSVDDLYVLGLVYLNLHKDKEAEVAFNKVLALAPATAEAEWGLAEVLRRKHNYAESEKILNKIIKSDPGFSPTYITLAYIRYIQMNFNEAVRLANKVLEQGQGKVDLSNYVRAYLLRGGTKGMIAHYGKALSKIINGTAVLHNLKRAQELQPESAGVKFGLGSFYLLAPSLAGGDLGEAQKYLEEAVKIDPLFADAYVRLAQLYKIKGDTPKYNVYINKALEIDPKNELALDVSSGKCRFVCP